MNGFNLSDITDAKLGTTTLGSIYLGSTKLWPLGTDYSKEYFTIEALKNTTIRLHKNTTSGKRRSVAFSRNGKTWNSLVTQGDRIDYEYDNVELSAGEKIYIKAADWPIVTTSDYVYFTSSSNINVYGNANSIIDINFKTSNIMRKYMFYKLFYELPIVDASNLVLPSTPGDYSYQSMFENCAQLVYPPKKLSGTKVGLYGCSYMFKGCSSLIDVPDLPATTLDGYAYSGMFENCTSLTVLPKLNHITTITYWAPFRYTFSGCQSIKDARWDKYGGRLLPNHLTVTGGGSAYELMFNSCSGLKYAPELTETSPHNGEYNNMFAYCTSLYTLITHATSLGSNYFSNIVNGTGRRGTVRQASDVTWDSAQYKQFTYSGSGSSALMWGVSTGDYTSGDYQT